jgi:hypothetical protein
MWAPSSVRLAAAAADAATVAVRTRLGNLTVSSPCWRPRCLCRAPAPGADSPPHWAASCWVASVAACPSALQEIPAGND